jgi:uroporphyrinogen decarboxylase
MAYGGNVDPVKILKEGKPEDVARATKECIDKAWYGAGFVVMPGCDLPDAVSFENLQTFLNTARTYSPSPAA